MALMLLFALAGIAPSGVTASNAVTVTSARSEDLESVSMDDLVARLQPINQSGHWDAEQERYILDPVPAELRQRLLRGTRLTDVQWQRALQLSQAIFVRPKWPADEPVAVFMAVPAFLDVAELRARPSDPTLPSLHAGEVHPLGGCATYAMWCRQSEQYQILGAFPLGGHRMSFDVEVEIGEAEAWPPYFIFHGPPPPSLLPGILWRGRVDIAFEIVSSLDEVLPPRNDADLDEVIRNSLCLRFSETKTTRNWSPTIHVSIEGVQASRLLDTAVSMEVELWCAGNMVCKETRCVESMFGTRPSRSPDAAWFTSSFWLPSVVLAPEDAAARATYSLRIRGSPQGVLHLWDATTRWNGDLRIPLSDLKVCDDH
jgi:hypothetical protein